MMSLHWSPNVYFIVRSRASRTGRNLFHAFSHRLRRRKSFLSVDFRVMPPLLFFVLEGKTSVRVYNLSAIKPVLHRKNSIFLGVTFRSFDKYFYKIEQTE